ncbi:hypothetical protein TRVL_07981 [Trypanosoma vivax]|nr:hypothetical protein TRVL_07981 [Trypanosoma vivax]
MNDNDDPPKEMKEGDFASSHPLSVNATPFEPASGASQFSAEKWHDRVPLPRDKTSAMCSSAAWAPFPLIYPDMYMLNPNLRAVPHMTAVISDGLRRYSGVPFMRMSSPTRRVSNTPEGAKRAEKGSLSAYAKPWSPTTESGFSQAGDDGYTQLKQEWSRVPYRGEMVVAPLPFKEMTNLFVHSLTVKPLTKPRIQLELFNYLCARCTTRTFFGRLSCREADITLRWVADDVPPLRIAHLIEQITDVPVCALFIEKNSDKYELWLEKPEKATHVVETISGALWTCPMFHGYAVHTKTDEEKEFLLNYITSLKEGFPETSPYPMRFVEASTQVAEEANA